MGDSSEGVALATGRSFVPLESVPPPPSVVSQWGAVSGEASTHTLPSLPPRGEGQTVEEVILPPLLSINLDLGKQ